MTAHQSRQLRRVITVMPYDLADDENRELS